MVPCLIWLIYPDIAPTVLRPVVTIGLLQSAHGSLQ